MPRPDERTAADRRKRATAQAGPVTVTYPDGSVDVLPPYTQQEAQRIARLSRSMVT